MSQTDFERRFGGVRRLYGSVATKQLDSASVCIVGVGGVGSWSVEALARMGIGKLTLVDLDVVAESNTNRQIHALGDQYGKAKVDAMAERVRGINPFCQISCVDEFVSAENLTRILDNKFTVVIDAIDQVRVKAAMINFCKKIATPIIVAGAAGGQMDPTQISVADLSKTTQDPLLAKVRSTLRREYNFPRDSKKKFGVSAVFSTEQLHNPKQEGACDLSNVATTGLNCSGFGSSVCVTSVFGMIAAAEALKIVTR